MSSGGTRAGQAASSRRVKQELVRLLFGAKYSKKGPEAHKKLDPAFYSYADLKRAYFAKLQDIHPDKNKALGSSPFGRDTTKQHFHDLQRTWDRYNDMAKTMNKVNPTGQGDFTKFGVGCSFSDNEYEKALRSEITDQACRGWFSAGELPERFSGSETSNSFLYTSSSLIDEDMFVEMQSGIENREEDGSVMSNEKKERTSTPRTLIPGYKHRLQAL